MKKQLYIVIALILTSSLCGCGADVTQTNTATATTETTTATTTSVVTPSSTSSPTMKPTPSPTVAATAADLQAQLADAPEIDGLTKAIQDESVIYTYNEGNPYNGAAGEYAGVYKANVFVEGEQVGGVCLSADVCLVLLNNALADIPEGEDKIKIAFPVDVTSAGSEVGLELFNVSPGPNYSAIMFRANQSFDVVSCLPYSDQQFTIGNISEEIKFSSLGGEILFNSSPLDNVYSVTNSFSSSECMHFLNYGISVESIGDNLHMSASFGDGLGYSVDSLFLYVHDASSTSPLDVFDLLTIKGKVIFIEKN